MADQAWRQDLRIDMLRQDAMLKRLAYQRHPSAATYSAALTAKEAYQEAQLRQMAATSAARGMR